MKVVIALLLVSLIVGQLLRLPLPGQGGGLLLSDIATVLVLAVAFLSWIVRRTDQQMTNDKIRMTKTFRHSSFLRHSSFVISPFLIWSLFTLTIHFSDLGRENFLIASLYWLRLTATLLLLPALLLLFQKSTLRTFSRRVFIGMIATLAVLGFLQLIFFPNLNLPGWDPHQGRLVATWLDPNFIGGFFAIVLPWLLVRNQKPETRKQIYFPISSFVFLSAAAALLLTQSRSSFIALALGAILTAPLWLAALRSRPHHVRLAFAGVGVSLLVALVIFPALFLPQRLTGLVFIDDTAALRLASLKSAWQLYSAHPIIGVGYNAYQFAARDAGLIGDFTIHSRAGADNSLLTLAVTTGLFGVILFFLPWAAVSARLTQAAHVGSLPAAAAITSVAVLFIHSQFVNSFLYSHLLIALIVIIAITMSNDEVRMTKES